MKTILFSMLMIAATAVHASGPKIGIVLVEKILTEAPQIEAINSEMMKQFGARRDELKNMEEDIKKLQEEYKRNELVMTQDKLDELKNKIVNGIQVFKQKEAGLNQDVNVVRNEKLGELQTMIRGIIKKIAEDDDYDIILSDGVVHTSDKYDITGKVLKRMKKEFK